MESPMDTVLRAQLKRRERTLRGGCCRLHRKGRATGVELIADVG